MKIIQTLLILCLLTSSCSKNEPSVDNPNGGGGGGGTPTNGATSIVFENNTFAGSCIVTYSDGATYNGTFANGTMNIPSTSGNKVIESIQPQNQQLLIIGRKEGAVIKLNYNGTVLSHRTAVNGFVPIGTFAEFQLINKNTTTLGASYKQEAKLYFMNKLWTPIGNSTSLFNGSFDGGNYEIDLLNVSVTGNNPAGLFGNAPNAQFTNIIISSGTIKGQKITASIAAYCGSISNCKNYANVEGEGFSTAGIAGEISGNNYEISNCHNYGKIKGGICAGLFESGGNTNVIKNCTNNNTLTGTSVSGITTQAKSVEFCVNNGSISANNASGITHGILTRVLNCTNNGAITGVYPISTIAFTVSGISNESRRVENCTNTADLSSSGTCAGIAGGGGDNFPDSCIVRNCKNSGKISSSAGYAGGIAANRIEYIFNCHNTGNVVATISSNFSYAAGISVFKTLRISDCSNTGNIESIGGTESMTGGIMAYYQGTTAPIGLIERCFNSGSIKGRSYVGGILGYVADIINIKSCYNSGTLTGTINPRIGIGTINTGGIVGSSPSGPNLRTEYCYNTANSSGGILGDGYVTMIRCFWKQGTATFPVAVGGGGGVTYPITAATVFSATAWPSESTGWTSTNWKSLGSWNNGNPTYPKLIFEN